jgi:hypothetical protein
MDGVHLLCFLISADSYIVGRGGQSRNKRPISLVTANQFGLQAKRFSGRDGGGWTEV